MAQRKTRRRCPNGSRKNKKTNQCEKKRPSNRKRCPNGSRKNKKTNQCEKKTNTPVKTSPSKKTSSDTKVLPTLSEDKEYNIYIICKTKTIFKERVKTLQKYKGKIHTFHYVKAVFLKDTPKNR